MEGFTTIACLRACILLDRSGDRYMGEHEMKSGQTIETGGKVDRGQPALKRKRSGRCAVFALAVLLTGFSANALAVTIDSFTASNYLINSGEPFTIHWDVSYVFWTRCIGSGQFSQFNSMEITSSNGQLPTGGKFVTITNFQPGQYLVQMDCYEDMPVMQGGEDSRPEANTDSKSFYVTINAPPGIAKASSSNFDIGVTDAGSTWFLNVNVSDVDENLSEVTWEITGPTFEQSIDPVSGATDSSSWIPYFPVAGNYTVLATVRDTKGASGAVSWEFDVYPAVDIGFAADPDVVTAGEDAILYWNVSNADSCTALDGTGGWAGSSISLPTGSQSITMNTVGTYVFRLRCSNPGSVRTATTTVEVIPPTDPGEFSICCSLLVDENVGLVTTQVFRNGGSDGAVSIDWATVEISGHAVPGSDYLSDFGTLYWADGETSAKIIQVTILDDAIYEVAEDFLIRIQPGESAPPDVTIGTSEVGIVIRDDDPACEPHLDLYCPGTTDPQSLIDGCLVQLNGGVDPDCGPTPINWNWGDGSPSEQSFFPNSHVYDTNGQYNVVVSAGELSKNCMINLTECTLPVSIDSFTASPSSVVQGDIITLSWSVSNADGCTASGGTGGWAGSGISLPSGSRTLSLADSGTFEFVLLCENADSSDSASILIDVPPPPAVEIQSFTASPPQILEGETTTLSWSVSNADDCTASGGAGGWAGSAIALPSGSRTLTLPSAGSYSFTLVCHNIASSDSAVAVVDVSSTVSIDSFTASPAAIEQDETTTLAWSVSHAASCSASGGTAGWAGSTISLPSGNRTLTLSSAGSYTFTLTCQNELSSDSASAVVDVSVPPSVFIQSFTASPSQILEGESTTLSWTVNNADSCTASGGGGGWAGSAISLPSGSRSLTLSSAGSYDFVITCVNDTSSDTQSAVVSVSVPPSVVIQSFLANPTQILEGESTTLSWSVSDAESCSASGGGGGWVGSTISLPSGSRTLTLSGIGTYQFVLACSNDTSTDEASSTVTVSAQPQPDLRVDGVDVDRTSLISGESINVSATLRNVGNASAIASTARFYLSDDSQLSSADSQLGTAATPALSAGQSSSLSKSVTVAEDPGDYWVGVCVDIIPDEVSADNNCWIGPRITVTAPAGTACTSRTLSCGDSAASALDSADCMTGPLGAGYRAEAFEFAAQAGDHLFIDAEWGFDGYLLLEDPRGLIVSENDNFTGITNSQIELEAGTSGIYTVWATSFAPNVTGPIEVTLDCNAPAGPDLVVATPQLDTTAPLPGQALEVVARLRNDGDAIAGTTTLHYMLSSDSVISLGDTEIGLEGAPSLDAGAETLQSLVLTAPATPGPYSIGVCADAVAGEAVTANNCSPPRSITVAERPACAQSLLACGAMVAGELSRQDCTESPRGAGYLSEVLELDLDQDRPVEIDARWSGLDGYLYLESPSGVVVAENDDGGPGSRIEYVPARDGIYRLWLTGFQRTATGGYQAELHCGSALAPDLVATEFAIDDSEVFVSSTVDVEGLARNTGGAGAGASTAHFMLSRDDVVSSTDEVLASVAVSPLGVGASQPVSARLTAPSSAGNYWLGICVEPVAGEILTANNCSSLGGTPALTRSASFGSRATPDSEHSPNGTLLNVFAGNSCEADAVSCGDTRTGSLAQGGCDRGPRGAGFTADPLSFTGNQGDTVSIDVGWNGVDGYLYLEDPLGNLSGQNDDFDDSAASRLELELALSGTYTIWPTAFDRGAGGSYQLSLACGDPKSPDLAVDQPQLNTTTLRSGQNLSISTRAHNKGGMTTGPSVVEFVLAANPDLSGGERILGSNDLPSLESGASQAASATVTVDVPPGTYYVGSCADLDATELDTENNCAVSAPITVQSIDRPIEINNGLNDAWFDPATDGQGFFINVFPDVNLMFLSWFTFDTSRPPGSVPYQLGDPGHRWLTAQGTYDLGVADLDVYLSHGGVFDAAEPAVVTDPAPYGSMTVSFSDCNHGLIEYDLPAANESGSIPITRVAPDNIPVCQQKIGALVATTDAETDTSAGFSYNASLNDAWFNPQTNGQGFFFNIYPGSNSVFLSWFTYDLQRPPANTPYDLGEPGHRWLTAQGRYEGDTAQLKVFRSSGGVFNEGSLPPGSTVEVGDITATFTNCNSGTVSYVIDSVARQGEVPIQRTARDTIPACEEQSGGGSGSGGNPAGSTAGVSPSGKQTMENMCNGSIDWMFNWPDVRGAGFYLFELYRNDSLAGSPRAVASPRNSEFAYRGKEPTVDRAHLNNWKWRYRPVMGFGEKSRAGWSKFYTFNVRPPESPCLD